MSQSGQRNNSSSARLNYYHSPRQGVLGKKAGQPAPAWRSHGETSAVATGQSATGSKIFLSSLPLDVTETEVEELFKKTVGPLKEAFLIYNHRGASKGMAIVEFQRTGDAQVAREKYDGKFVDGRRPIKVEIVSETGVAAKEAPRPPTSLAERLSLPDRPAAMRKEPAPARGNHMHPRQAVAVQNLTAAEPTAVRRRYKKGPRRLQKRTTTTVADLDKEMEDYRAQAPPDVIE